MRNKLFMRITAFLLAVVFVFLLPVRVHATTAGAIAAAKIVSVSTVSVNPVVVAAACLIALGVWAGAESGAFENCARVTADALSEGGWVHDGAVEVFQTVTAAGEKAWYVAGDMLESVRGWLFDSSNGVPVVYSAYSKLNSAQMDSYLGFLSSWCAAYSNYNPHIMAYIDSAGYGRIYISRWPFVLGSDGVYRCFANGYEQPFNGYNVYPSGLASFTSGLTTRATFDGKPWTFTVESPVVTDLNVSLGNVPTSYIDGTSALEWAPEYANRQLRVINTGGGNNPDGGGDGDPDWKWYMPLALGSMAALLTQVQSDQWSGVTPDEFPEYDTIQEFEILDKPEIDDFAYIEIQPITQPEVNPDPSPDPGSDPDEDPTTAPGTGTDPGTDPGTNPGTGTDPGTNPGTGTDPGVGTDPGTNPDTDPDPNPDTSPGRFSLDLTDFFPFCIPFDLYDMLKAFDADPVAPRFELELDFGTLGSYPFEVDFSQWDRAAQICRRFEYIVFCIGLAACTKKLLGW